MKMVELMEEDDCEIGEISGTTREGYVVLPDGKVLRWGTTEEGERFYFTDQGGEEILIYDPVPYADHDLVVAAVAIEEVALKMETEQYGLQ